MDKWDSTDRDQLKRSSAHEREFGETKAHESLNESIQDSGFRRGDKITFRRLEAAWLLDFLQRANGLYESMELIRW